MKRLRIGPTKVKSITVVDNDGDPHTFEKGTVSIYKTNGAGQRDTFSLVVTTNNIDPERDISL